MRKYVSAPLVEGREARWRGILGAWWDGQRKQDGLRSADGGLAGRFGVEGKHELRVNGTRGTGVDAV